MIQSLSTRISSSKKFLISNTGTFPISLIEYFYDNPDAKINQSFLSIKQNHFGSMVLPLNEKLSPTLKMELSMLIDDWKQPLIKTTSMKIIKHGGEISILIPGENGVGGTQIDLGSSKTQTTKDLISGMIKIFKQSTEFNKVDQHHQNIDSKTTFSIIVDPIVGNLNQTFKVMIIFISSTIKIQNGFQMSQDSVQQFLESLKDC